VNATIKAPAADRDYEDVFAALDAWLRDGTHYREVKLRPVLGGVICALYSGGNPVAQAGGIHTDDAIANALDLAEVAAEPAHPDDAENRWNEANVGGAS